MDHVRDVVRIFPLPVETRDNERSGDKLGSQLRADTEADIEVLRNKGYQEESNPVTGIPVAFMMFDPFPSRLKRFWVILS